VSTFRVDLFTLKNKRIFIIDTLISCNVMWIDLAQDRDQWWTVVSMVVNIQVL